MVNYIFATLCFHIEIVSNMLWSTSALVNVQPPSSLSTLCSRPRLKMFFWMTMIWWWWQWYDDGHHWSCEKCYNLDDIDDIDDADNGNGGIVWQTWRKGTRLWGYLHGAQPGCDLFKKTSLTWGDDDDINDIYVNNPKS